MSHPNKITIVVPFLNEKDNLPVLLQRVAGVFAAREEDWELLLVDDGSTDGSAEWAVEQAQANRHVRVVRLSRNFGPSWPSRRGWTGRTATRSWSWTPICRIRPRRSAR